MKTQNELQKMNDQQLAFELACLVFGAESVYMANFGKVGVTCDDIASAAGYVDLNDWSWIMPLAVEHDVSHRIAERLDGGEKAFWAMDFVNNDTYSGYADTPQRAIAICLVLKLQEVGE